MDIEILSENLIFFYIAAIILFVSIIEGVSRIREIDKRRIFVICLSIIFLGWLDFFSLIILTLLSLIILATVKKKIELKNSIYPLSLLLIGILIAVKDYHYVFNIRTIYVPLGISYYFFRLISFLIEYSKDPERISGTSPINFFSWIFFFPVFLAGPILRFGEFHALSPEKHHVEKPANYTKLILAILLKVLLVNGVLYFAVYDITFHIIMKKFSDTFYMNRQYINLPLLSAFSLGAFFHAYIDLLLYTEISKALAGILGFTNVDNFNRPLLASNISQFWQRWHLSLSNWTRDYVFFPMLIKTRRTWTSTYASMLMIGIWHSATPNWIVWALAHGTAINLYGALRMTSLFKTIDKNKWGARFLRVSGNVATIYFVGIVFTFVAVDEFSLALKLLYRCF